MNREATPSIHELTPEQQEIRARLRQFADEVLKPVADDLDRDSRFPQEEIRKIAALGFCGVKIPKRYGGQGWGEVENVLVQEEINRVCPSTGVTLTVHNGLVAGPLIRFGTPAQRDKYFPRMATGELLGAYALSEPGHGSNPAGMEASYRDAGDRYVLDGTKCWITNGSHAGLFIVFATRDRGLGSKGISAFLVEQAFPGFRVGRKEAKLGIRASSTSTLHLEGCEVPKANVLGEEGKGFKIAMDTLDFGRVGIAGQAIGIAQGLFEAALDLARTTSREGAPLIDEQGVAFAIADMAMETEAARLLTYRAARLHDEGRPASLESSMAKLFASETANRCARRAMEIGGYRATTRGSTIERLFRDAKITEIYEGTSEVQRIVISRRLAQGVGG